MDTSVKTILNVKKKKHPRTKQPENLGQCEKIKSMNISNRGRRRNSGQKQKKKILSTKL